MRLSTGVGQAVKQSDEALIRLSLEQGSQYFGKLVKRHSDYLFGLGMRLSGGNHAMAQDMSQQAFIKAFKYLASFDPKPPSLGADPSKRFRNWLTGIAVNCYSDLVKVEAKYNDIDQLGDIIQPKAAHSSEELSEFSAMVRSLSTEERQLVTLRFIYEYSIDEIAGMLGLKSGTVKSKLSRAVARLRKENSDEAAQSKEPEQNNVPSNATSGYSTSNGSSNRRAQLSEVSK